MEVESCQVIIDDIRHKFFFSSSYGKRMTSFAQVDDIWMVFVWRVEDGKLKPVRMAHTLDPNKAAAEARDIIMRYEQKLKYRSPAEHKSMILDLRGSLPQKLLDKVRRMEDGPC